jgi:ABC-type dipeptide/oligopeptide/nickel transport system permease subunit
MEPVTIDTFQEAPERATEWKRFSRVFFQRKLVIFGIIILALLVIVAIFAPFLTPYSPTMGNIKESMQSPSAKHLLGTDLQGRDVLTRLIYGSRIALAVGFGSVLLSGITGTILGMIAGYVGGLTSNIIMRIMDALLGFPMILLAIVVSTVLGGGLLNVIIALSIASLPGYARVMHGLTLSIKENDYILSEKSLGAGGLRSMFAHILPNAFPSMIVLLTLQLGGMILGEAGLSFLGVGINPPTPAWGSMVSDGQRYLLQEPWLSIAPGVAIMLVVFAFNLVGDGIRDALDPRLRGII